MRASALLGVLIVFACVLSVPFFGEAMGRFLLTAMLGGGIILLLALVVGGVVLVALRSSD